MRVLSGEIESFAAVFAGGNARQIYWERFDENFEAAPVCALARLAIGRHQKMEERGLSQLHCAPSAFFLMYEGVFYLILFLKRRKFAPFAFCFVGWRYFIMIGRGASLHP